MDVAAVKKRDLPNSKTTLHPLSFGLRNPLYKEVIAHLHKMNPGFVVDVLDPQAPMLLAHCACGEQEAIYLEEVEIEQQDASMPSNYIYRYRCQVCKTATEWAPSRAHAKQLWDILQTN